MDNTEMIRKAEPADVPALLGLLLQVGNIHAEVRPDIFVYGSTKYDAEALKALMRDELRPIFVHVNDNGEVDGYCFCEIQTQEADGHLQPMKTLYIDDLCIDANARGRGVGSALYYKAVEFGKEMGCYHLTLNVWTVNPEARQFYDSRGLMPMKTTMETLI